MGKLVLCVLAAIVLWVGASVWRQGPERAFGGLFAMLASPQYGEADAAPGRSQRLAEEQEAPPGPEASDEPWWSRR
jgi:hypothetical protein